MTKTLKIAKSLALPLDAVTSTIVVYGGKGMGKTNFASVLVEEFAAARLHFAVIDPMGVWWGLRHDAGGKGPGVEALIVGGIHGDLPIEPTSGAVVADLVVDEDASVIIDISRRPDGSMWAIAERVRFVTAFAKRLYQRQGERRRPINLVIDEAARFAPQMVRQGETEVAACMGAIAVIVEEGRNVGVGVTLVTQRSARLNKDVAELADCMIAFRIIGPNSMRAVLDWLGEHVDKARLKEIGEQLRSLPRGSALVVSPGWLEYEGIAAMRKRRTFDSSKTPEAGKEVRASGSGAKPDLAKYRARLAEVVEQTKANDPKALKARVVDLEKQLAAKGKHVPPAIEHIVEKPVLNKAAVVALERSFARGDKAIGVASGLADRAGEMMRKAAELMAASSMRIEAELGKLRETISAKMTPASTPTRAASAPMVRRAPVAPPRVAGDPAATSDAAVGGGLRRILVALAQCPRGLTNRQIGIRAGLSSKSGTFSTYISRARQHGWIADRGVIREITDAGLAALGAFDPLPTGSDLASYWLNELGGGAARILAVLIEAGRGVSVSAEQIGERAGLSPKSGTYSTYVSRLRGLELIAGRGDLQASEELFE